MPKKKKKKKKKIGEKVKLTYKMVDCFDFLLRGGKKFGRAVIPPRCNEMEIRGATNRGS